MGMHNDTKKTLLISMPFAGTGIPSIQLSILEEYLKERNINVKTRHLYLKAADFYELINYNYLIFPPNDSYTAQMVFSKYVFPEHWEKTKNIFKEYFNKQLSKTEESENIFSFEKYVRQTDKFYNWILKDVNWQTFDIIGFTLNYGQFLPSLAIAKKIKELDPEKKIVFGGSRTIDKLGIKILEAFDYIDFIVSGDGEESLYLLSLSNQDYKNIPNLIYRFEKEIIWNKSNVYIDLNTLPHLSYDSFYDELATTSESIKQYFNSYGRMPIEISRGCWWNKCSFCNIGIQCNSYREKNVDNIVEEIEFLSNRYEMLVFQVIGNILPKNYKTFLEKIRQLNKDFSFIVETRAGCLKSEDYTLLKEAGFTIIQTGIETFSQNYLNKMNKGTRVIDNIAVLKFCKENSIKNAYNIITNYPNEEKFDFEETGKNIQFFYQYLDPPQISNYIVKFGSPIYNNPENFNIERLEHTDIDKIMFPKEYLKKNLTYFYDFKRKNNFVENDWKKLVEIWRNEHESLEIEGVKKQTDIDKLVFYYLDGRDFLKIYDKRNSEDIRIYVLNEIERETLLSCIDVTSYKKLSEKLPNIPDFKLAAILHTFEQNGIVFREDDYYLSLPLCYSTVMGLSPKKESKIQISNLC